MQDAFYIAYCCFIFTVETRVNDTSFLEVSTDV